MYVQLRHPSPVGKTKDHFEFPEKKLSRVRISSMFVAIAAVTIGLASANQAAEQDLFPAGRVPGEVPGAVGPEYWENRTSANGYTLTIKKNVSMPTITPYLVAATAAPTAAVIIAPGGAYMQLAMNMEGSDVAARFNAMGVSAFVLKYRVPARPAQPGIKGRDTFGWAPLQDAQRAMGLVRQRASEWNIDAAKVGFAGFSAGGHLTVHLATAWGERTYLRVDEADDLPCRPDFALPIYPWKLLLNNDPASTELAPEVSNVTAATPPVMIAQNEDDPSAHVEGSLMFYYKLKRISGRKPTSALHLYPTGGHGFGLCQSTASGDVKECCDWPLAAQRFMQDLGFATGFPAAPCTGVYQADGDSTCHPNQTAVLV